VALIEFVEVSFSEVNPEEIRGYHLDVPEAADQTEGDTIEIIGWVLGARSPAIAVEVTAGSRLLRRVPINVPRPDVAEQYPDLANSKQSGFKAKVQMGGAAELRLLVHAVLEDQKRVQLVGIHAQRRWREQRHETTPLASVIIPCYGQAHFLAETIESVVAQRYPHFEVVVIDDGSADNTEEVALQWPRVRYVRQDNSGLAAARNTGLRRSLGDYVVFLDADDRLLPEALDAGLTAFAAHPESAFVVGHCRCITVDGMPLPESEQPCVAGDPYSTLLEKCWIYPPATVMFRRSVFQAVGNFDVTVSPCADYDLYLRIAKGYPIHCHHHVVADYRKHGAIMTGNPGLMLSSAAAVLRSQRHYAGRSPLWKESYKKGMRFIRECYGPPLAEAVRTHALAHDVPQATRDFLTLVRHYPMGLVSLLRHDD